MTTRTRPLALALFAALLAAAPAVAETLVSPGVALDATGDGRAAGAQGSALVASNAVDAVVAVYTDDRDGRAHVVAMDGASEGESRESVALPTSVDLTDADLAGATGGFLLVWADAGMVRAQRLNVDAGVVAPSGAPFVVVGTGTASQPRVASGPSPCEWTVAFRTVVAESGPVRTACIDAGGVGIVDFDIVAAGGDFDMIRVGGVAEPVLVHVDNNGLNGVRAGRVTSSGAMITPTTQVSLTQVSPTTRVVGTSDASGGRVAWFSPGSRLFGRRFSATLTPQDASDVTLSTIGASVTSVSVVGGTRPWVVWTEGSALSARTWAAALGPIEAVESGGANGPGTAAVTGYTLLLYTESDPALGVDVLSRRLALATVADPVVLTVGPGPRTPAAVSALPDGGWVAVWGEPTPLGDGDVWLAEADANGLTVGGPRAVSVGASDATDPTLVVIGDTVLVAWAEDGTAGRVRRFAAADLTPLDPTPITVCSLVAVAAPAAAPAAAGGTLATLAFEDPATGDVHAVTLDAAGTLEPPPACDLAIATSGDSERSPQVATSGGEALFAWMAGSLGSARVEVRVDNGTLGATTTVVAGSADVRDLALASLGNGEWLLATERADVLNGGFDLVLTRFMTDGTVLDEIAVPGAPLDGIDANPVLVSEGARAALLWRRGADPGEVRHVQYESGALLADTEVVVNGTATLVGGPLSAAAVDLDELVALARETGRTSVNGDERLTLRRVRTDVGPIADVGGPYSGDEGDLVSFDGSGSAAPAGSTIASYDWDIGGVLASGESVQQALPDDGAIRVRLTVIDTLGRSAVDDVIATVANVAPVVALGTFPRTIGEETTQTYTALWQDPGPFDDVQIAWDFGDESTAEGAAIDLDALDHSYAEGNYLLCVTVTDKDGESATDCAGMIVVNTAPLLVVIEPAAIDEGQTVTVALSLDDPGADPVDLSVDWDDGTVELFEGLVRPYPTELAHTYVDNAAPSGSSPFDLCVTATDDAPASVQRCTRVIVDNVLPQIVGTPATQALEGIEAAGEPVPYTAAFALDDPSPEILTTTFASGGLPGVSLTLAPGGRSATVSFVPTLDLWRLRQPPIWDFSLSTRDDAPAPVVLNWSVTIVPRDDDADGLPDTCEDAFGVLGGADDDDDLDGSTNLDECFNGTDPTTDDRPPGAPSLNAPPDGGTVGSLLPFLSVTNVPHGAAVTYEYEFELYDAPELFVDDLVDTDIRDEELGLTTRWQAGPLVDRSQYWWRARALSGRFAGPWMDVATFEVELPNATPTQPVGQTPTGQVRTLTPTFRWTNSTDFDADRLTYRLEVFGDEGLTDRQRLVESIPEAGPPTSELTLAEEDGLPDNADYWWHVTAVDARGAESVPSVALSFRVNLANDLPGTPVIVSPLPGAFVGTAHPELVVAAVEDADGDDVTYAFVVAPDEAFDNIVEAISDLIPGDDDRVRHEVGRNLDENRLYYWRAAARDLRGLGGFAQGDFFVNAANDPPLAPTIQAPSAGQFVDTPTPQLVVRNTRDPEGDAITYDFELADEPTFQELAFEALDVDEGAGEQTSVTVSDPLEDGVTYHLRVRGVDSFDAPGPWTTSQFTVQLTLPGPGAPTPVRPVLGETVLAEGLTLELENAEGGAGALTYEFAVYRDEQLNNRVYRATEVPEGETGHTLHVLTETVAAGPHWWHARAVEGASAGPWSDTATFVVEGGGGGDGGDDGLDAGGDVDGDASADGGGGGGSGSDGCGCAAASSPAPPLDGLALAALVALALGRRRRRL